MDNYFIDDIMEKCPVLKFKFAGVWSADIFPKLKPHTFIIVNASQKHELGTHWLLLVCVSKHSILFWDSLGNTMETYVEIYLRCITMYSVVKELKIPLQGKRSNMCGAYCIFMAHEIFSGGYMSKWCFTNYEVVEFINNHLGANKAMKFEVH